MKNILFVFVFMLIAVAAWAGYSGGGGSGSGTDDQKIDVFQISGTELQLSLEGDAEATKTVELSSLQDGTGTDDQTASEVTITDTLDVYAPDTVQGAFDTIASNTIDISSIITATNYTIGTTSTNECRGVTIYATASSEVTFPELNEDYFFTIASVGIITLTNTPAAGDKIFLNGIAAADGESIIATSTNGTCFVKYYSADGWYVWDDGTFAEETP